MLHKLFIKFIVISIIATLFSSSFFISPAKAQATNLEDYLEYFYNRYSLHFDDWGLVYKAPGYGVPNFSQANTAREILSLAVYYKYRALNNQPRAKRIIRAAILNSIRELNSRNHENHSFSDAWAQMMILSLIDQLPGILTEQEENNIYTQIISRAQIGILAEDSSNRAALSAVYWQHIINNLYYKELIGQDLKSKLDKLIYQKIKKVLTDDITQQGWYQEGNPMKFNPHYHLITAFAFSSYSQITGDIELYLMAKKMTKNLRTISFPNGMIEARIGNRPVGLGVQFYLGVGLLNYKFNFDDSSVYFNYASADKFFSDPRYPNRLEYHSTINNSDPNYHDDISFSNLAELALLTPTFTNLTINSADTQLNNTQDIVTYQDLQITQITPNSTAIKRTSPNQSPIVKGQTSIVNIAGTYGLDRLSSDQENIQAQDFFTQLRKYNIFYLTPRSKNTLAAAYIYGGYAIQEIVDTLKNGPRAVHPIIPAYTWRHTPNYQEYLKAS